MRRRITDLGRLRYGGMGWLFSGLRAPSTTGTSLPPCTFSHRRSPDAVAARFSTRPSGTTCCRPRSIGILLDVDDTVATRMGTPAGRGWLLAGDRARRGGVDAGRCNPAAAGTDEHRARRGTYPAVCARSCRAGWYSKVGVVRSAPSVDQRFGVQAPAEEISP